MSKTYWFVKLALSLRLNQVQFSRSLMSNSLQPHGLQHARLLCPSPTRSLLRLTPIESVIPSNHLIICHPLLHLLKSFPASGSFQMSQFFASGSQSIGVSDSTSVLPMNIQYWFPLGWTGWISLQSKRLSGVFSGQRGIRLQIFSPILRVVFTFCFLCCA